MLGKIIVKVSQDDKSVGYVYMPNHPGMGKKGVKFAPKW